MANPKAVENVVGVLGRKLAFSCKEPVGKEPKRTREKQIHEVLHPADELSARDPPQTRRSAREPVRTPEEQIAIILGKPLPPTVESADAVMGLA